ncbi:MAG: hypothetical protein A4S09_14655 [Proteobacteria bacterium SG_bin7]|nr:MAG: hypothetical protein A4S09_14655 [Proteobacteria bacterium SG_bin7]
MVTLVARMPTVLSHAASAVTALVFVNTLAYPTRISFSRVQNIGGGVVITLERSSPPMAALEDISAEELTAPVSEDKPTKDHHAQPERLVSGIRLYHSEIGTKKVVSAEPLRISRHSIEFQGVVSEFKQRSIDPVSAISVPLPTKTLAQPQADSHPSLPVQKQQENGRKPIPGTNVSGEVDLNGGLAFTGGAQKLTIQRYVKGQAAEMGTIHLQRGTFEIRVAEKTGRLVAQMKNEKDEVLGEGFYSFEDSPPNIEEHIKIKVYAKSTGINGQAISAYSFSDQKIVVKGAKLKLDDLDTIVSSDEDGVFGFSGISGNSVALVRATATEYIPSIQFVSGSQNNEVLMYPKKMVDSLINITEEKTKATDGLIWGKVSANGKPLSGVTIELAGLDTDPIYFNALYLPDKKLKETGANGMFAYLRVPPGLHQLRATLSEKNVDGVVVPVASGYVSPVALEIPQILKEVKVGFRDFGAKPQTLLSGILRAFGTEEIHDIKGEEIISMSPTRLLSFFDGIVKNFYPGRVLTAGKREEIEIPMLEPNWLQEKINESGHKVDPNKGAILLQIDSPLESLNVNGKPMTVTDKDVIEVEQKGIILINVTSGVNTILSKSAGKPDADMNIVVSDPGTVSVIDLRVVSGQ